MNRNPFIAVALNAALAFFCVNRAGAQAWLPGTNGSIYNPNLSTNGQVGIGTNNPTATLEIANGPQHTFHAGIVGNRANTNIQMAASAAVIADNSSSESLLGAVAWDHFNNNVNPSWAGTLLFHCGTAMTGMQYGVPAANLGLLLFQNCNNGVIATNQANIFISPQGTLSASFLTNGNVGIGTSDTKGYKFAVNGDAVFNKVVVKPYPWADYVFDSAYKLRPLENLAQYIRDNHHLPEIPSADSVEKAGIDVGANQAALLKKVEELTLYVIEQNKLLQQQAVRLGVQAAKLEAQTAKLAGQARRIKRLEHKNTINL